MTAWVLPDHIADVLPSEARHIEELRRLCLDTARSFGYELIMPPLLEHLESLLSGSGSALDLQTFKLIDQLSGRTMGLRADTTAQVARIDAHLLNRVGVTRLCYCGPVLHTKPSKPFATREPLQMGAEIYGHQGLEADLEIMELAMECLSQGSHNYLISGPSHANPKALEFLLDLSHARIVPSLLAGLDLSVEFNRQLQVHIAAKDTSGLEQLFRQFSGVPSPVAKVLIGLVDLYGSKETLTRAKTLLSPWPDALQALEELGWLETHLTAHLNVPVYFDLAEVRGYSYYTGPRFSVYTAGLSDALVRGGRYDEVGAVFGRKRPAAGFSLDLKDWVQLLKRPASTKAVLAPWSEDASLREMVLSLRAQGETVLCVLPGQQIDGEEFLCDRKIIQKGDQWIISNLR